MAPLIINKKSWHYRMARKFNWPGLNRCFNICDYTRLIIVTSLSVLLMGATAAAFFGYVIGDTIAWVAASIFMGEFLDMQTGAIITSMCTGTVIIAFAITQALDWRARRLDDAVPVVKQPSTLTLAYRSWKDKYCARVEFKD